MVGLLFFLYFFIFSLHLKNQENKQIEQSFKSKTQTIHEHPLKPPHPYSLTTYNFQKSRDT